MAEQTKQVVKPKVKFTDEQKDSIRDALYDVGINLKKVEEAVNYVTYAYKIDLTRAQELIGDLKKELGLE